MLVLNYTYRIYPDRSQETILSEWLETCRRSYNYALRELKDWIASRKCPIDRCNLESEYIMRADYPFPSYHEQQNSLPQAKKIFPLLAQVPSQVLQTNIRRLHDAWDFFRSRGFGFPRFKKYGQMKSLLFPQFRSNPLTGWQINLPKLGRVQINLHRPIPNGFVIKQVRVIKKAKGWFAVISIRSDLTLPECDKARQKVEKQHNHIAFKRKDYQFKLAQQVCDMGDSIFVEDIDFRIMAKGFLGKHSLDASFGQFRSILQYVCKQRGKYFGVVDHRGTSQTCPNCRAEVRKTLADRVHSCPECHYVVDRDVAAAQEICNRGIEKSTLGLRGTETVCQVEVSGVMNLDNWRRGSIPLWAEMSQRELGSPRYAACG